MTISPQASPKAPVQTPAASPQAPVPQQGATPQELCRALTTQQATIQLTLDKVESERYLVADRLRRGNAAEGVDKAGLEKRLSILDDQIFKLQADVAGASARVVAQAAIPGACEAPPRTRPTQDEIVVGGFLTFALLMPIVITSARRMWSRGSAAIAAIPDELAQRLGRLEQSMDSVAIEVERIGEGQRFMTGLLAGTPPEKLAEPRER
jgi:hypothetical protein